MIKTTKELLDYLTDENSDGINLWEMEISTLNPENKEAMLKIFSEEQLVFMTQLIKNIVGALKFHNSEDSESHEDIRNEAKKQDAKLRNHRHPLNETFSAKPEF